MHGEVPSRRAGRRPDEPGARIVCMRISFVLPLALLFGSAAGAQVYLNCQLVPGWEQSGTKREYTADNLIRIHGWQCGKLSAVWIRADAGDQLHVGAEEVRDRCIGDGGFRSGLRDVCFEPRSNSAHREDCHGWASAAATCQFCERQILRGDCSESGWRSYGGAAGVCDEDGGAAGRSKQSAGGAGVVSKGEPDFACDWFRKACWG